MLFYPLFWDFRSPIKDIVGKLVFQAQSGLILTLKVSTNLAFANNILREFYHPGHKALG